MADLLIRAGTGAGTRYRNLEDTADVWHWEESPPPGAGDGIPYACLAAMGDVSRPAPFLYTVELEVAEADLPAVFAWYEQEHLRLLTASPGCIGGSRYRRLDGGAPNLLAAYRFEHPGVNQTPEWIAGRSTPWTERIRATFRAQRRCLRQLVD